VLLQCSPVLLVDTVKPGWPVLHANSSWHKLLLQQPHQATSTWQSVAAGSSSTATSSSSSASSHDIVGQLLWPILAGQLCERGSSTPGSGLQGAQAHQPAEQLAAEQVQQQQQLTQQYHAFAELARQKQQEQQQQQQNLCAEQVQQLVAERQCFTLAGLQLPGLLAQPVSLSFRCVLCSCQPSATCHARETGPVNKRAAPV
jgi:hypothetical protein